MGWRQRGTTQRRNGAAARPTLVELEPRVVPATFVAESAPWRFWDRGSDPGLNWQTAAFDDSAWSSGRGQFGYGEGDETTVVGFGPDAGNKFITTYFRTSFAVSDPAAVAGLTVRLLRDDGAVVYLNGVEIQRQNLSGGAIGYATLANATVGGDDETAFFQFTVAPGLLVAGTNLLAVEIHQASAASTDLSFACRVDATLGNATQFAVIGDYGQAGASEQAVADLVQRWSPDLVLTVGDNNYPSGAAATIDANIGQYYHDFIGNYTGSYGAGSAVNRFFPTLGNHDWGDVVPNPGGAQAYLDYFTLPGNERYYTFTNGPVAFFAIDSDANEPDGITSDSPQGQWLKQQLAASNATWKIVYFHHPPFSSGLHGSTAALQWPLRAWGASAVLSGHEHNYERVIVDGLPYFINGLGGQSLRPLNAPIAGSHVRFSGDYGAMYVEADSAHLRFSFVTVRGVVIDSYQIVRQTPMHAAAAGVGGGSQVKVFNAAGALQRVVTAYPGWQGETRVATGDVTGDGVEDLVVGRGAGGDSLVKVFDGATGLLRSSFLAFAGFNGGVFVAIGDCNADGIGDIVVGAGAGGGPHVKVFDGASGALLRSFFAYAPAFHGGVTVAAGDLDGDGFDDFVVGAASGGPARVRAFSGRTGAQLREFTPFPQFAGGVTVASGDVNGDGYADIVVGAGPGRSSVVQVFSGASGGLLVNLSPFGAFAGGVRVAIADRNRDGRADLLLGAGRGGGSHVKIVSGANLALLDSFFAFGAGFTGGVFVG